MNFASNNKKKRLYQKKSESSNKRRKIIKDIKEEHESLDRFNFFIDILNNGNKAYKKSEKIKEKSDKKSIQENKENNVNYTSLNNIDTNEEKNANLISIEELNNAILDDIEENTIIVDDGSEKVEEDLSKNIKQDEILKKEKDDILHILDKPKKYISKKTIIQLKENKIIERNINLILNKDKSLTGQKKINKKEIDIVNEFQLNALGYINFYMKKRKQLLTSKNGSSKQKSIFSLNEEEIEKLIDQEWMTLKKEMKKKNIEKIVKKQTKLIKRNLKNKKHNEIIENTNENNDEISNENLNENLNNNNNNTNIPNIPNSEMINKELKEYTELKLMSEIYNDLKQIPIPHFSVIKHPPNPFSIYTKDNINKLIKKDPSLTRPKALTIVAKNWKSIDKEEKKKYMEKAKEYKEDYEDLIKYAYLQRALINNPDIAKLCLEYQLKHEKDQEVNMDEKDIDFKNLDNDDEIIKAFKYIVRKFPQGYPLASPVLRFPERGITQKLKKSQNKIIENLDDNENDNDNDNNNDNILNKKFEKFNSNIKPKSQAFDFFVKDRYKLILKSTPGISLSNLFDELEREWKYLSYEDKLPYILLEIKDIKRYYIDQCELSKERRGRKRDITYEVSDDEEEEIEEENEENSNTNNDSNKKKKDKSKSKNKNKSKEKSKIQNNEKVAKPKKIKIKKNKKQKESLQQQTQPQSQSPTITELQQPQQSKLNENSTFIEDSEDDQDFDNNLLYNKVLDVNETNNFNNNNSINNNQIPLQSANNEMEETYIDSDTSEEYLAFDSISRKFMFENSNDEEIENSAQKDNIYDHFDIQTQLNNSNNNTKRDDTFIPVADIDINNSLNYRLSQDTVVYNTPEEQLKNINKNSRSVVEEFGDPNIIKSTFEFKSKSPSQSQILTQTHSQSNSSSSSPSLLSSYSKSKTKIKSPKEYVSFMNFSQGEKHEELKQVSDIISTSQSQTENETEKEVESQSTLFKNSSFDNSKTLLSSDKNSEIKESNSNIFSDGKSSIQNENSNSNPLNESNLETPKNSQTSKIELKPLRPIRKSSAWKFGNDIGLIQQVSEERIGQISRKDKNISNDDDDDEITSSSSSSSSSDEDEDDEDTIFIKNGNKSLSNEKNKESKEKGKKEEEKLTTTTTIVSKISSPIKYKINKRIDEDEEENEEEDNEDEIEEINEEENQQNNEDEEIEEIDSSHPYSKNNNVEKEEEEEEVNDSAKKNKMSKSIGKDNTYINRNSDIIGEKKSIFIFENSYVTPKKNNNKYKYNYSSSSKKNNFNYYYGSERKKYDLF